MTRGGVKKEVQMTVRPRPEALQAFLDAVQRGFGAASPGAETKACLARVFERLEHPVASTVPTPERVPATVFLGKALGAARASGGATSELADALADLDSALFWRARGGPEGGADLSRPGSIANAMVVGPNGIEDRKDVWVGISLVPPGVRYPEHRHSPEEIYLFLTDGRFRHGESGWFSPGIGGTLYNEPNILHSMESPATAPLLAIWCLFDERHA